MRRLTVRLTVVVRFAQRSLVHIRLATHDTCLNIVSSTPVIFLFHGVSDEMSFSVGFWTGPVSLERKLGEADGLYLCAFSRFTYCTLHQFGFSAPETAGIVACSGNSNE